jgi:CHAT domain-containing protein
VIAFFRIVRSATWTEVQQILEAHPDLITLEAEQLILQVIDQQTDPGARESLEQHLPLLRRCREIGVERALEEAQHTNDQALSEPLNTILIELEATQASGHESRYAELCRQAIAMVDATTRPQLWASLKLALVQALDSYRQRDRGFPIEESIAALNDVLTVVPRAFQPDKWARIQYMLGDCYRERELGDPGDNIERALKHYQLAQEIITRENDATEWAGIVHNIAVCYRRRARGDLAENIDAAISAYRQSLEVFTREHSPDNWANITHNLGLALMNRPRGDSSENQEAAITCFLQALEVYEPNNHTLSWAGIQASLAIAYRQRHQGIKAENIERAIAAYEQALTVRTRQNVPLSWATTVSNLAIAYTERIKGERADNQEQALYYVRQALEVLTLEDTPRRWAVAMITWGGQLLDRIRGDRADNVEQAIVALTNALQVFRRDNAPLDWAQIQLNLGKAYDGRIHGARADNLEAALAAERQALEVLSPENAPMDWALATHNLAGGLISRVSGDTSENIEQAIELFNAALQIRTRSTTPLEWARSLAGRATAYRKRLVGDHQENLGRAIADYETALQVVDRQSLSLEWARIMVDLASAFSELRTGNQDDNLDRAIELYEAALQVRVRDSNPQDWARTMHNIGYAYYRRRRDDQSENIDKAIECYRQALEVRRKETLPLAWADTMSNLATAYWRRQHGDRSVSLANAAAAFRSALEVYLPDQHPQDCRGTAANLGYVLMELGAWRDAFDAFTLALQAAEVIYAQAIIPSTQQHQLGLHEDLFDRIVACCTRLAAEPQFARAGLVYAEGGKSRTFFDQMGQGDFPATPDVPPPLLARERELLALLRQVEQTFLADNTQGESDPEVMQATRLAAARRGRLRSELEALWSRMVAETPSAAEYVALRRPRLPSWDDLSHLADQLGQQVACVSFYELGEALIAFIWRQGWNAPQVVEIALPSVMLRNRYVMAYNAEIINRRAGRPPRHDWLKLGEVIFAPLLPYIGDATLLYIFPYGPLHLMPLHALTINGEPLLARYQVIYAPSAPVLARSIRRVGNSQLAARPLVLGYTSADDPIEQELFIGEAKAVAAAFGCEPLLDGDATADQLRKAASSASIIHLSCHGAFDGQHPLDSAIYLGDGPFTARDWMRLVLSADLVTLSACQTGLNDINHADENVGLSRALLYAGADSALLTLWSVSALTTREWMLGFYSHITSASNPLTKVAAFQAATLELRDRYSDPYYWAPFILLGNWQ